MPGSVAQRPWCGDHSGIVSINNIIYIIGGFNNGQGKVQTFNPSTNRWSTDNRRHPSGADGSMSVAAISGMIYACGGLGGSSNKNGCAMYDPGGGGWTRKASMLRGVDHAAAGTDGEKLYVFGGRHTGVNRPSNGEDYVQIYDPVSDNWSWGNGMPIGRGGMGKATYHLGYFYVMGGERQGGMHNQVHLFDGNSWSNGPNLPTAVHGISPAVDPPTGKIYVASGGTRAGYSQSSLLQILSTNGLSHQTPTASPSLSPTTPAPSRRPTRSPSTTEPTYMGETYSPTRPPTRTPTSLPSGAPTLSPSPNFGSVVLLDARNHQEVGPLQPGAVISIAVVGTNHISFMLQNIPDTLGVESVVFRMDGEAAHTENNQPHL